LKLFTNNSFKNKLISRRHDTQEFESFNHSQNFERPAASATLELRLMRSFGGANHRGKLAAGFHNKNARHNRLLGEVAQQQGIVHGYIFYAFASAARLQFNNPID